MQNEQLLKRVRLVTIIFAAVYILLGVFMIAFQAQFKSVLGYVLGAAACLFGAYRLFVYFKMSRHMTLIATDLFIGTVFLLLGIVCLVKHSVVLNFVEVIFGLLLFAGALVKIQNAIDMHHLGYRNWWLMLVFGLVSVVFSVLLILQPDFVLKVYMTIAGVFMIYDGAANLASVFFYNSVAGRIKKGLGPNRISEKPAQEAAAAYTVPHEEAPFAEMPPASEMPQQNTPKFDPETGERLQ